MDDTDEGEETEKLRGKVPLDWRRCKVGVDNFFSAMGEAGGVAMVMAVAEALVLTKSVAGRSLLEQSTAGGSGL